ncbi:MAG: DUF2905 domain-containing protein [Actinomycetes bacterium]|jgi:hypothetical protein|nr:DUF2905 domain-containing protein [Acidimicrobiia bacterium]
MRTGTALMWIGLAIVAIGAVLRWAPWLLSWFGNLPGDIRHEGERTSFYFPITSMLILSAILTIVLNLFFRRNGS